MPSTFCVCEIPLLKKKKKKTSLRWTKVSNCRGHACSEDGEVPVCCAGAAFTLLPVSLWPWGPGELKEVGENGCPREQRSVLVADTAYPCSPPGGFWDCRTGLSLVGPWRSPFITNERASGFDGALLSVRLCGTNMLFSLVSTYFHLAGSTLTYWKHGTLTWKSTQIDQM